MKLTMLNIGLAMTTFINFKAPRRNKQDGAKTVFITLLVQKMLAKNFITRNGHSIFMTTKRPNYLPEVKI